MELKKKKCAFLIFLFAYQTNSRFYKMYIKACLETKYIGVRENIQANVGKNQEHVMINMLWNSNRFNSAYFIGKEWSEGFLFSNVSIFSLSLISAISFPVTKKTTKKKLYFEEDRMYGRQEERQLMMRTKFQRC